MYPLPPGEKALARRSRETCSACVCMGQREWVWVGFGAGSGVSTVNINFKPLPLCVCPCGNVRFFASRVLFLCVMRVDFCVMRVCMHRVHAPHVRADMHFVCAP